MLTNRSLGLPVRARGRRRLGASVVTGFVAEVSSRFGLVVSDKVAAGAIPVLGALGGATINVIFMDHFQRIAQGHFTIRRLERIYGRTVVERQYELSVVALIATAGRDAALRAGVL